MIGMEACTERLAACPANPSGDPREDAPLSLTEAAFHLLTQYSVSWISLIGRFLGGCSTAFSFTRRAAAA